MAGVGGKTVHHLFPGGLDFAVVDAQAGAKDSVHDLVEVPFGDSLVAVAIGDDLALLGDAEGAVDRAGRLGQDRVVGWAAAATHSAAATVEYADGDTVFAGEGCQVALDLVESPGGLDEAAFLVAVGIADHHFLQVAAQDQVLAPGGNFQ